MDKENIDIPALPFSEAKSVNDIIKLIYTMMANRMPVAFGVEKLEGRSIGRTRREANQAAIDLLNTLGPDYDGRNLTDEQRSVLAAYTGVGGLGDSSSSLGIADTSTGGAEFEFYTPSDVAQGMWDMLNVNGLAGGNILEPSAGPGVFQEHKPAGVLMTAVEIDKTSGAINKLLHPEDDVSVLPFEAVAGSTPDGFADGLIGNVPFGISRGAESDLDPAYKSEKNVGAYIILRSIDKLKPGALGALIVPTGMTDGAKWKKLREKVSARAEFLGAHRMPNGTFADSGTDTVTDVWLVKRHPEDLENSIKKGLFTDETLAKAKVMWETFIRGKWFVADGKRFIYGDMEKVESRGFKRLVVRNNLVKGQMREKLAVKFDSRIDWQLLDLTAPENVAIQEGDKRFVGGAWYVMENGAMVLDTSTSTQLIDKNKYGVDSYRSISSLFNSPKEVAALSFSQIAAIYADYPEQIPKDYIALIKFALSQSPSLRDRCFAGSVAGLAVTTLQDKLAMGNGDFEDERAEVAKLVGDVVQQGNNPHKGRKVNVTGEGAKPWLTFMGSVTADGDISDFLKAGIDQAPEADMTSDAGVVIRRLFNNISLDPVSIADFRRTYAGELPADDNEALKLIAQMDDIAITPDGYLVPMDRATSGDVATALDQISKGMIQSTDEAIKANFQRQFELVQKKRNWTPPDDIVFSMDDRWFDRRLVLEFLQGQGFSDLVYVKDVQVEDGQLKSDLTYSGSDGVFTGYRYKTVMSKDKLTGDIKPVYKRVRNTDGFSDQLENYLNGNKPRGINAAEYADRLSRMNEAFNTWIRQRDEIDDLVNDWNLRFNSNIPYEHSGEDLNLFDVSGRIKLFGYQNSEVRRLSEEGGGICGFGTGLGKTPTSLALEAFNYENGRAKRTAFVVPKTVLEKFYHEQRKFYSEAAFSQFLFIGVDPVLDGDGKPVMIPDLDSDGQPKFNKITGEQEFKTALKEVSSGVVKERLNAIPYSNYRGIVFTKEQWASVPLRPETINERSQDMLFAMAQAERVNLDGTKHRDAQKKNRIRAEAADTGTTKDQDVPYFEDMLIDNVIVDEGHNYRNSFAAGREASQLAYLPTSPVAKMARDMAVKSAYLMGKYNGRGVTMLTATPLVNSPIDAFNMLSHVISVDEWHRMGIFTPDDFVKVFGVTETASVMKITGEIEEKTALVGFKNLGGLRGMFHKYVNMKNINDVSDEVKIPEIKAVIDDVPMTAYQAAEYEALRKRADDLANGKDEDKESDSIFSIIRDMDRLVTDPEMYARRISFSFPKSRTEAIKGIAQAITDEDRVIEKGKGENAQLITASPVVTESDNVTISVADLFEGDVMSRLAGAGVPESEISHFIPPKYAKLIQNLKDRMPRGKQIIFTDEKTQHNKLRRILASSLGIDISSIGILNADTVAEASKGNGGAKLKPVKEPVYPKDDATTAQFDKYFAEKAKYDEYVAALSDMDIGGLESIAANYLEGRTPIIICNKKAEIGVDLHIGTVAIHHLTIPWTPASVQQREGRGARVGSVGDSVESIFYSAKGSFDDFRIGTVQRKKNWISEIMTSDQAVMENENASAQKEMRLLLAEDPEQREKMMQEYADNKKAKDAAKNRQRAMINLDAYLKGAHAQNTPIPAAEKIVEQQERALSVAIAQVAELEGELQELSGHAEKNRKEIDELTVRAPDSWDLKAAQARLTGNNSSIRKKNNELVEARKSVNSINRQKSAAENFVNRIRKSESAVKRLKPEIEHAVKAGYLDIDQNVIDHPENFWISGNRTLRVGGYYSFDYTPNIYTSSYKIVGRITKIDIEAQEVSIAPVWIDPRAGRFASDIGNMRAAMADISEETQTSVDDYKLLESARRGLTYEEISGGQLSKEQFEYCIKNMSLFIRADMVIVREKDSFSKSRAGRDNFARTPFLASLVYPDSTDENLKQAVAIAYRSGRAVRGADSFLKALYGNDYMDEIAAYGVVATSAKIAEVVDAWMNQQMQQEDSRTYNRTRKFDGTARPQIDMYMRGDMQDLRSDAKALIESVFSEAEFLHSGEYSNIDDFTRYYYGKKQRIVDDVIANVEVAVKSIATNKKAAFEAGYGGVVSSMIEPPKGMGGRTFSSYFRSSQESGYDLVKLYSEAVQLSLAAASAITEASFYDRGRIESQIDEIDAAYLKYVAQQIPATPPAEDVVALVDAAVTSVNNNIAEATTLGDGMRMMLNPEAIVTRYYRFAAGAAWAIQDDAGKSGALYDAKEELKSRFDAKFFSDRTGKSSMRGAWWLISNDHSASDIISVINKFK